MEFDFTVLRAGRRAKKLKQADVANILGCTSATVANMENGTTKVSAERVAQLADIYGIAIETLFIRR